MPQELGTHATACISCRGMRLWAAVRAWEYSQSARCLARYQFGCNACFLTDDVMACKVRNVKQCTKVYSHSDILTKCTRPTNQASKNRGSAYSMKGKSQIQLIRVLLYSPPAHNEGQAPHASDQTRLSNAVLMRRQCCAASCACASASHAVEHSQRPSSQPCSASDGSRNSCSYPPPPPSPSAAPAAAVLSDPPPCWCAPLSAPPSTDVVVASSEAERVK